MSVHKAVRHTLVEDTGLRIPDSDRARQPPLSIPMPPATDRDAAVEPSDKGTPLDRNTAKNHSTAAKAKKQSG